VCHKTFLYQKYIRINCQKHISLLEMTTEIKYKIRPAYSFIDEAFDVKKTSGYQLTILIGVDGIAISINEKLINKYIAFESYTFQQVFNFDLVTDLIDILVKTSKLIEHKYKSVVCVLINNFSTIIPNPLFEEDKKELYLKFNAGIDDAVVLVDEMPNLDAKTIFAFPLILKTKLDSLFTSINYHHFSSGLIESLLIQNKNQPAKRLFVHIQPTHLETIVIEGKNLLFYNTFNHHSAEDFIYYLLFVCEQLQLNPENIEVFLIGEIEKGATIFSLAQKYFRNLKFGTRNDVADYSYQLQTLPKHYYYSLFNNYLL